MNTYSIPKPEDCLTYKDYCDYVTTLPWSFTDNHCVYPNLYTETVQVDGTIDGFTLIEPITP